MVDDLFDDLLMVSDDSSVIGEAMVNRLINYN
jgi:hypothetical protein